MMENRHCFIKRNYYTLEDLIMLCEGMLPKEYLLGTYYDYGFKQVLYGVFNVVEADLDTVLKSDEATLLWDQYVVPFNLKEYITFKDDEELDESDDVEFQNWMRLYCVRLRSTFDRYKKMLDLYDAEKSKLLDGVKASNTVRFNDTPQNGGDFSVDSYTSTYTKTETETDLTTVMARLDEIERLYKDVYKNWASEFRDLFFSTPEGDM